MKGEKGKTVVNVLRTKYLKNITSPITCFLFPLYEHLCGDPGDLGAPGETNTIHKPPQNPLVTCFCSSTQW